MVLLDKVLYIVLKIGTWVVLYTALFAQKERKKIFPIAMRVLILTGLRSACVSIVASQLLPFIMIVTYYVTMQIERKHSRKALIIEIAFSYAIAELLSALCSLIAAAISTYLLQTTKGSAVTVVCAVLLGMAWCVLLLGFKKKDMSALGEKYSVAIFVIAFILFLGVFKTARTPYISENRNFYIFLFFVLGACLLLLIAWAYRERKVLEKETRIGQALEQTARERDDLLTANHRLGKTLPELEHKYDKLAEKVRRMETLPHKEEFAAELDALSSVRCRVVQQTERVDTDTGVPGLKGSVEYVAHIAEERGVLFGCRILAGLDKLSDYPGITEQSLRQLLRNLLDNAIHAAARAERSPKMVQCMMGVAGNCYQIDVYDSGDPFQSHILENLGRMGNTTDGNGVGLPDVLDISARCGASIFVTHFDEVMATGATKRVTIRFDGEAMAHLSAPGLGEAVEISMGALLCHGGYHEKGENRVCTKS